MKSSFTLRSLRWALILPTTLALILLSACGARETAQSLAAEVSPVPASPTRTTIPFEATIAADKATAMAQFANNVATSEAQSIPEVWLTLPPNPTFDPSINPQGFVSCEPAPGDQVLIENCWARDINEVRVGIRAGALITDPEQGALQVNDKVFLTASRSGRARIVQEDGLVLTIRTASGKFFSFDIATRQWLAPLPTATPRPLEAYTRGIQPCVAPPSYFLAGNCWADIIDGRSYQVRAGAAQPDPTQGYINVRKQALEPGSSMWEQEYLTPTKAGRIEVVDAQDLILTFRAEDGSIFAFDLATRTWVTPPVTATPAPATATFTTTPSATVTSSPTVLPSTTATPTATPA